jgi:hypothetical protein
MRARELSETSYSQAYYTEGGEDIAQASSKRSYRNMPEAVTAEISADIEPIHVSCVKFYR